MTITRERFDMAMSRMSGADWEQFEQLASAFLVTEYPALRTMASPSGDGGRDSELFCYDGEPSTAMQYSVAQDWDQKVKKTVKRLSSTFPTVKQLVYVTNQVIGADADGLKTDMRKQGVFLDIRDRSWFLDRANTDSNREGAAEALSKKFVDPLLPSGSIDKELVQGLDSNDAKMALLFLEMQVQDTARSLGLTKASYDTLTLAALRDTSTAKRRSRQEVYARVHQFLPSQPLAQIKMKVDGALRRLATKAIRHRTDRDEFHLLDAEIKRVSSSIAKIDKLRRDFEADLVNVISSGKDIHVNDKDLFVKAARRVIETYFLRKGEDFARAAVSAVTHQVDETTLKSIALTIPAKEIGVVGKPPVEVLIAAINTLITTASEATSAYLSLLLESYTLFAFLAETPDVQKATRSMFGSGEIWLDTSVLLPVLAETAVVENQRPFTEMFRQARKAGLKLHVTHGVLVEVERHINRSKAYARSTAWDADVPFLFAAYAISGGSRPAFSSWTETFIGDDDPVQDIADYLASSHQIRMESASNHERISEPLARAVRQAWQDIHFERRGPADRNHLVRLAEHDSEVYLHVLSSRLAQQGKAPMGYTDWWLTLDTKARSVMDRIPVELRPSVKIGPVLSIDYLIRYLALGPGRDRVDVTGAALAKVYAEALIEPIPDDMMSLIGELRASHADLPEHVIQRRIRDTLNQERSRSGSIDSGGLIGPADLLDAAY